MNVRGLFAAAAAALCVLVGGAPAAQTPPPASPYAIVSRDGRRPLPVRIISGQEFCSLDDLARLFNLTVREDALAGGLTVSVGNQTIILSANQPLASVAGRMISLPATPLHEGRAWFVPIDFISRALGPVYATRLDLRKPSRLIVLGEIRMPRIAGRIEPLGTLTRVTLEVAPATPHSVSQEATRLLLRFEADALDASLPAAAPGDVLQGVRVAEAPAVIALDLGPRFASFRVTDQLADRGAIRIVIDLIAQTDQGAVPASPSNPPTPAAPLEGPPLLDLPPAGGLGTIVIDAGHGGDDGGARGIKGTLEKAITLGVARRLKGALEARLGVRVILTREADQMVAIDQRAALANNNKADLFVSLHANASVRAVASGAEVYYLSLADYGDEAQRIARGSSEMLPVLGGGNRDIEVIAWEMAQARHIDQSAALARAFEATLRDHVPMSPRAIQQAPLRVLVGANMPAVLIEMGFLTNPQQEQQLAGDDYQNALVQALVDGIVRYRDREHTGVPRTESLMPSAPPGGSR